jgi:hypothetical protein
MGMSRLQ